MGEFIRKHGIDVNLALSRIIIQCPTQSPHKGRLDCGKLLSAGGLPELLGNYLVGDAGVCRVTIVRPICTDTLDAQHFAKSIDKAARIDATALCKCSINIEHNKVHRINRPQSHADRYGCSAPNATSDREEARWHNT